MNTNEAKQIRIEEYLHSLGYNPVLACTFRGAI